MERGVDPDTAFLADNGDRWVLEVGCNKQCCDIGYIAGLGGLVFTPCLF